MTGAMRTMGWAVLVAACCVGVAFRGSAAPPDGEVVQLDPALSRIVAPGTKIEKVAGGFAFVEGPVWMHQGYLLFSDIPHDVINKWSAGGKVSVYLKNSGYPKAPEQVPAKLTEDNLIPTLIGSNGLTLDRQGRLIICEHGSRQVERLETNGSRTVLADRYQGKRLNSPNDVVVKSDGAIYFTDPPFGLQSTHSQAETPVSGVYRIKDGKLDLIIGDLKAPNGLAFSPGEKYLYVDDSGTKMYWRYPVLPNGTVGQGKLFYDASKDAESGVPDGMKVDRNGNLYACGPGGMVYIFTPEGKVLGKLKPPEGPANLAWGDADGKALYMTAWSSVYRIRLQVAGLRP